MPLTKVPFGHWVLRSSLDESLMGGTHCPIPKFTATQKWTLSGLVKATFPYQASVLVSHGVEILNCGGPLFLRILGLTAPATIPIHSVN